VRRDIAEKWAVIMQPLEGAIRLKAGKIGKYFDREKRRHFAAGDIIQRLSFNLAAGLRRKETE